MGIRWDQVSSATKGLRRGGEDAVAPESCVVDKEFYNAYAPPRSLARATTTWDEYLGTMTSFIEVIGWVGALLVLAAYGLVSTERLSSRSLSYQALNIGGALGLVLNSGWNGAIPSAVVNLIWIGIGLYALAARRAAAGGETRH